MSFISISFYCNIACENPLDYKQLSFFSSATLSGTFLIFWMRLKLEWHYLVFCTIGTAVGLILGTFQSVGFCFVNKIVMWTEQIRGGKLFLFADHIAPFFGATRARFQPKRLFGYYNAKNLLSAGQTWPAGRMLPSLVLDFRGISVVEGKLHRRLSVKVTRFERIKCLMPYVRYLLNLACAEFWHCKLLSKQNRHFLFTGFEVIDAFVPPLVRKLGYGSLWLACAFAFVLFQR